MIQVIGQEVLDLEYRTSVASSVFNDVINNRTISTNDITDFDEPFQTILEQYILNEDKKRCEIITVPVFSKLKRGKLNALPVLICVVNTEKSEDFVNKVITEAYRFCLPILINTSKLEEEARIKKQCQSLLHVARRLFSHLDDLSDLLREIMTEARRLTNSERCSLFLLDPDHIHLVAKVFDGVVYDNVATEVRIAKDQGIAGRY